MRPKFSPLGREPEPKRSGFYNPAMNEPFYSEGPPRSRSPYSRNYYERDDYVTLPRDTYYRDYDYYDYPPPPYR